MTYVALRKESVDRNLTSIVYHTNKYVALRKESVDRNVWCSSGGAFARPVALRKESVDRN